MINIFNLFIVLFTCWMVLLFTGDKLSWFYIISGFLMSAIISFASWKIRIINKNTHFLFLNFGFYLYLFPIILQSFYKSLFLLLKFALVDSSEPSIHYFSLKNRHSKSQLALFISVVALMPGIFCIGIKRKKMIIHALDSSYFDRNKLEAIYNNLYKVNDDRLV